MYEQREIEINTGAKTLSTRVSAAIANIEKEKAAADEELKKKHAEFEAEVKAWNEEKELIAKSQHIDKVVKINGVLLHKTLDRKVKHRCTNNPLIPCFFAPPRGRPIVGGAVFKTSNVTLQRFPDSMIAAMFSGTDCRLRNFTHV